MRPFQSKKWGWYNYTKASASYTLSTAHAVGKMSRLHSLHCTCNVSPSLLLACCLLLTMWRTAPLTKDAGRHPLQAWTRHSSTFPDLETRRSLNNLTLDNHPKNWHWSGYFGHVIESPDSGSLSCHGGHNCRVPVCTWMAAFIRWSGNLCRNAQNAKRMACIGHVKRSFCNGPHVWREIDGQMYSTTPALPHFTSTITTFPGSVLPVQDSAHVHISVTLLYSVTWP